ncbi:MAG: hypothetical protein HYT15_00510 [Candidatus Magasanikbacteria bacterium]|nr:hypothetical protein [Candidatus Magasanikbacteria bacterium]
MKKIDALSQLGLSQEESTIYRTLVEGGVLGISDIAERTGLYRPMIYRHIPILIEKGLVLESKKGKRNVYSAEHPENLKHLVRRIEDNLSTELPALMHTYAASLNRPVIRYYYGEQGIRQAYFDFLSTVKKSDIIYRYESPKDHTKYDRYIPRQYRERILDKTEVDWLIITNEITKNRKGKEKRLGRLFKTVPSKYDLFMYDITQFIYRDKVSFIDFKNEVASIIESPTFAQFQRKIFKLLWDRL